MNKIIFFRNAALAFSLMASGASFAAEVAATTTNPGPGASYATEIRSKMANMTPEQRAAFREEMQTQVGKMTPEQREAFRADVQASSCPLWSAFPRGKLRVARASYWPL